MRPFRVFKLSISACVLVSLLSTGTYAQKVNVILKNGMIIGPGVMSEIATVRTEGAINSANSNPAKVIIVVDDGLRQVHFNRGQLVTFEPTPTEVKINFPFNAERVASKALTVQQFSASPQTMPFDALGRRFYRFDDGRVTVQGITEITPQYVRVQGLAGSQNNFVWDMRMALSSIEPEVLRKVLIYNADPNNAKSYQDIVDLYWASKRFVEAREMLVTSIQKFPELEVNKPLIKQLDQLAADQLFEAADNARKRAGQHELARRILDSFDYSILSRETQLKVERQKELMDGELKDRENLIKLIQEDVSQVSDPGIKKEMQLVVEEVKQNLTPDTALRFSDYLNLRGKLKADQHAALAIGGWIFGSGLAEENVNLVGSAIQARKLIRDYLAAPARNDQLLEQLNSLEAGTPRYVARIVANMAPPVTTPESLLFPLKSTSAEAPGQVIETKVPGRYLIEVPQKGPLQGIKAYYLVQLPPEYNPFRKYPCVVTMHGESSSPEDQIAWWCGAFDERSHRSWGEASKNGYIVVAPYWAQPKQPSYNYTENEHSYVLSCVVDSFKRFSIDTDRVFLSGHMSGAEGAWDIAQAHPDLWAGCIVVNGVANRFIRQYWTNAEYVPFYFVTGELAAVTAEGDDVYNQGTKNQRVWDNYLHERTTDVMISIYHQRGLDHFQEDLPRIMEWMNLPNHVRNFAPSKFSVKTLRYGDRFFWWFETDQLYSQKLVNPLRYFDSPPYTIESERSKESNSIDLRTIPADQYTVWLTPDMVDFNKTVTIFNKGSSKRIDIKPESRTILQDVRQRGDRLHPFWAKVPFPG